MPVISVVVPVYNVEKYLRQCISSLVNQTIENIEIICVNDGSTDNSLKILEQYAQTDSRIRIVSKTNSGYGDSMNVGLACAKGEYIGIVESDDYALPDMFERLYQAAKENDVDIVKSNFYYFSEEEGKKYEDNLSKIPYNKVFKPVDETEILKTAPSIWSALYKKEFLIEQKILFNPSSGASYQDVSFAFRALLSAKRMICVPEAYLCYRSDNENSSIKSPKKVFCIMDEFRVITDFIKERQQNFMMPVIQAEKFIYYIGNYFRIDSIYQYAFLQRMRDELQEDYESGYMDKRYWSEENWRLMQRVRLDLDSYFEQTNIDYQNKYTFNGYAMNNRLSLIGGMYVLRTADKVIIYGAGKYGRTILEKILSIRDVFCFAVTEKDETIPDRIRDIPVKGIKELQEFKKDSVVIVAIKKNSQMPILRILKELEFDHVISISSLKSI